MSLRQLLKTVWYGMCAVGGRATRLGTHSSEAIVLMYHSFDTKGWKYSVPPSALEEQLAYLVAHKIMVPLADVVAFARGVKELPAGSVALTVDDGYADTYEILFPLCKKYHIPFTLFLTSDLSEQDKLGNLPRPSWEQLKEMHDSQLVSLEVHGVSHINWPTIEDKKEDLDAEVLACRAAIQQRIGHIPRFAAYPAGRRSRKLEQYLKEQGFEAAVAITEGVVRKGDNLFALRRVQVDRTMSHLLFKLRLSSEALYMASILRRFIRSVSHVWS